MIIRFGHRVFLNLVLGTLYFVRVSIRVDPSCIES
jgi:hypothetical protein